MIVTIGSFSLSVLLYVLVHILKVITLVEKTKNSTMKCNYE